MRRLVCGVDMQILLQESATEICHWNWASIKSMLKLSVRPKYRFFRHRVVLICLESDINYNPDSLAAIYVSLRAYQMFLDNQFASNAASIHPGISDDRLAEDASVIANNAKEYLSTVRAALDVTEAAEFPGEQFEAKVDSWIKELVRYGGAEIHNIASVAGGIVSQEVIKVITKQYVPVNNTVLFDGVGSKTQVLEL